LLDGAEVLAIKEKRRQMSRRERRKAYAGHWGERTPYVLEPLKGRISKGKGTKKKTGEEREEKKEGVEEEGKKKRSHREGSGKAPQVDEEP